MIWRGRFENGGGFGETAIAILTNPFSETSSWAFLDNNWLSGQNSDVDFVPLPAWWQTRQVIFFRVKRIGHDAQKGEILTDLWGEWPGMRSRG